MRKLLGVLCVMAAGELSLAASGQAVRKAYTDEKGWVHIVTADGGEQTVRPGKWQDGGFESAQIASDGKTVGWLANQMLSPLAGGTNYSYAISLELDVWRNGRVIRKFVPPDFSIQEWTFVKGGEEVAFHFAPPHGQEWYECVLFDVNTGKQVAHWKLDRKDYVVPAWATSLLPKDDLPGPDEISNWLPDDKRAAQTPRK